jgi:hypothetical protein
MAESLFDNFSRTDVTPTRYAERTYDFLNRVAGPYWQRVRDLLDDWWRDHPNGTRADIRGRIRNSDDDAFAAAFAEMYIYQVLRRVSDSVEEHPQGPTGRRPDFLARSAADGDLFVEVTSTAPSDQDKAQSRRLAAIYDVVNSIHFDDFVFLVRALDEGQQAPSTSGLKQALTDWVRTLDYESVRAGWEMGAGYFDDRAPRYTWRADDWAIAFLAIPRSRWGGAGGPTIGLHSARPTWKDPEPVRAKIRQKATAYGDLAAPFVLAILAPGISPDDNWVAGVFHGDLAVEFDPNNPAAPRRQGRKPNGAWYAGNRWRHPNISGVLMTRQLEPWNLTQSTLTLWHHPAPTLPVGEIAPIFRQARANYETRQIDYVEPAITPARFFDLSDDWPGPEPAFPE